MSPLTREQIIEEILRIVPQKFPLVTLARGTEAHSLRVNGNSVPIEDLYRRTLLSPTDLQQNIEQWIVELLRTSENSFTHPESFEQIRSRIFPMVLSDEKAATSHRQTVAEPLVPGLSVAYAIDSERSLAYVSRSQFAAWGITHEQLHEQAIENLVIKSETMAAQAAQDETGAINLIFFQTGDGYDASRILLPTLHDRLREYLGSPFLAAIPNRDILLCMRDEPKTIERVKSQVIADYQRMPHQVSDQLFLITADGIALRT